MAARRLAPEWRRHPARRVQTVPSVCFLPHWLAADRHRPARLRVRVRVPTGAVRMTPVAAVLAVAALVAAARFGGRQHPVLGLGPLALDQELALARVQALARLAVCHQWRAPICQSTRLAPKAAPVPDGGVLQAHHHAAVLPAQIARSVRTARSVGAWHQRWQHQFPVPPALHCGH